MVAGSPDDQRIAARTTGGVSLFFPRHSLPLRSPAKRDRRFCEEVVELLCSDSQAARDLKLLGRLAIVPGLIATVIPLMVLIFTFLSITDSHPVVQWFGTAVCSGTVAAVALGWFASRVRSASTISIGNAALTFSLGVLLLVMWRSGPRANDPSRRRVGGRCTSRAGCTPLASRAISRGPTRRVNCRYRAMPARSVRWAPQMPGALEVLLALLRAPALAPSCDRVPYL